MRKRKDKVEENQKYKISKKVLKTKIPRKLTFHTYLQQVKFIVANLYRTHS